MSDKRVVAAAGGATASLAALLLYRRLAGAGRLDINCCEDLEAWERQALLKRLVSAPPRMATVHLVGLGEMMQEIPSSLLALGPRLKALDLSGCAIAELPDSLGDLVGLSSLSLSANRLKELPGAPLSKLTNLVELDVSHNQLTSLPPDIGCLLNLRGLNAMNNQLEELPEAIGQCTGLQRLGLKANHLRRLPDSIGRLRNLVELYITDNLLEELPHTMGRLTALVKLQASFNKLKSLPDELAHLEHLELLRVACCELEEAPAALNGLPRLAWFSISGNPCCPFKSPRSSVPTINISEVVVGQKLGDGASGEVFDSTWQGKRVAFKIFRADRSPDGHSRDEISMAIALAPDGNLIRVLARLEEPLGILMEFCKGKPLAEKPNMESLLRCRWAPGTSFQLPFVLTVAKGVAGALEHMHSRGVCHGDVYAHNVLVDEDASSVMLCDYGASFPYSKGLPMFGGMAAHEAGEVRAFGLLLSDMMRHTETRSGGLGDSTEHSLLELVTSCISSHPAKRPGFARIGQQLKEIEVQLEKGPKAPHLTRMTSDSVGSLADKGSAADEEKGTAPLGNPAGVMAANAAS